MKKCPFCAEEIQDEAIKCKHCGSMVAPPQTASPTQSPLLMLVLALAAIVAPIGCGSDTKPDPAKGQEAKEQEAKEQEANGQKEKAEIQRQAEAEEVRQRERKMNRCREGYEEAEKKLESIQNSKVREETQAKLRTAYKGCLPYAQGKAPLPDFAAILKTAQEKADWESLSPAQRKAATAKKEAEKRRVELEQKKVEAEKQFKEFVQQVANTRAAMTDERGKLSHGAVILAMWALEKGLKVTAIKGLAASDYGSVMKDPDEERGRHICTSGSVIEIQAEKTPAGKLFVGGMQMGWGSLRVARFIAVGSSRGINQGTRARFCGVVIGRYSYPNSGGGTTHAVQLVGVFDIKENR